MRKYFIILLISASLLLAACSYNRKCKNNTVPINSGFVFINGKYIEAPYCIETRDHAIYINGTLAMSKRSIINPYYFDHDPGMPPGITKYMTLDETLKLKEPTKNISYLTAKLWYLFSHYSFNCAYDMAFEYIKSFPNVKNLTGQGLIESYADESIYIAIGGSAMRTHNALWSFNGNGPLEDEIIRMVKREREKFTNNLKNNCIYFIFTKYYTSFFSIKKGLVVLSEMINIMKQPLSDDEKINELVSIGLLSKYAMERNQVFISNFSTNSQLEKRARLLDKSRIKE